MTTTKPKPDELPLDEEIYIYCCGYFGRKLGGEFKERIKQMVNASTKPKLLECPITSVYDYKGGVDIKIGDFVYVHINYDYRYTDNASRAILASKIVEMITPTNKVPTCECGVKERKE